MGESEEKRRLAHRDYELSYSAWVRSLEADAAAGVQSARAELAELKELSQGKNGELNLLTPLKYEFDRPRSVAGRAFGFDDENEFHDPADLAVDESDPREAIVDFDSVSGTELQKFCDHFGSALVWASGSQPSLMQMGLRWLVIIAVMRPQLIGEMRLRLPASMISGLRSALRGGDALETGKFFRKPIAWVRRCTSLLQLGKRGYSAIYVLRGDLINSATCAAIGGLDNKSRQAANKPIQEFRDTFGGIKSLPMRGKETRKRCKESQEKN